MSVCMYACMYACVYVSMYVYVCIIQLSLSTTRGEPKVDRHLLGCSSYTVRPPLRNKLPNMAKTILSLRWTLQRRQPLRASLSSSPPPAV